MQFLLDTHAAIWFMTDDSRLPSSTKEQIKDTSNECYVSIASLWELAIKYSLNKLKLKTDLESFLEIIDKSKFAILTILTQHILANSSLEFHHRDPFDRLIIAQAMVDNLKIVTKDSHFYPYNVELCWDSLGK